MKENKRTKCYRINRLKLDVNVPESHLQPCEPNPSKGHEPGIKKI